MLVPFVVGLVATLDEEPSGSVAGVMARPSPRAGRIALAAINSGSAAPLAAFVIPESGETRVLPPMPILRIIVFMFGLLFIIIHATRLPTKLPFRRPAADHAFSK